MVSIILPTFNRAQLILETVATVLQQTYTDWELIILDDQSTDQTRELIAGIGDPRIYYSRTAFRLGITGARNEGMKKCRGEFIAFIDSDDLWHPLKLQQQFEGITKFPEAGFSLTGGYNFRIPGEPLEYFYQQKVGSRLDHFFLPLFKAEVAATTSSLLFRKDCLMTIGEFDSSKSFADVDFILRLAIHFKGILLYEPLFYRRLHNNNISTRHWKEGSDEGIALIRKYDTCLKAGIAREMLFRLHINAGERYSSCYQPMKAVGRFLKAWTMKPFSMIPLKKSGKAILHYSVSKAKIFATVSFIL